MTQGGSRRAVSAQGANLAARITRRARIPFRARPRSATMSAPTVEIAPHGGKVEETEPLTLLNALARAPAAAALVVGALKRSEDRKALRLVHSQLRGAVGEATVKLKADLKKISDNPDRQVARPPTARRWPRLEELRMDGLDAAAIEALKTGTWGGLRMFSLSAPSNVLDVPSARALAAALRRMPALRALELSNFGLPVASAAEIFRPSIAEALPQLRSLAAPWTQLEPGAVRALATSGWRLEELDLGGNDLDSADVAALVAAPTFALRRLDLQKCGLDATALRSLANAPWPLEELYLSGNDFSAPAAGPALAALSGHVGLRRLNVKGCNMSTVNFKALVEAAWPALSSLECDMGFDGPHELGAASFAGFPALEELNCDVIPAEAGVWLLASQRLPRLSALDLSGSRIGTAGLTALLAAPAFAIRRLNLNNCGLNATSLLHLANAGWPLEELSFEDNDLSTPDAGTALAALSGCAGLRRFEMNGSIVHPAGSKALAEAAWPALTRLVFGFAITTSNGPHALGAAAFAGVPALEVLILGVELSEAGARALFSRKWPRLQEILIFGTDFGTSDLAEIAERAHGGFPVLEHMGWPELRPHWSWAATSSLRP